MASYRYRLLIVAAVSVFLCWPGFIASVRAQSDEQAPASPVPEERDVSFIPVAQIVARSIEVRTRLREIGKILSDVGVEEQTRQILSRKEVEITAEKAKLESAFSQGVKVFDLRSMRNRWAYMRDELTRQEQRIEVRTAQMDARLSEIKSLRDLWQRTRTDAVRTSAPETVLHEVDVTVTALSETERKLKDRLDSVLGLQAGIRHYLEVVDTELGRIRGQFGTIRRNFFTRQESPVWGMRITSDEVAADLKGLEGVLKKTGADIWTYVDSHDGQVMVRILLIAGLLWLARWTRDVLKKKGGSGNVARSDADTGASPPTAHGPTAMEAILLGLTMNAIMRLDSPPGFQMVLIFLILPLWLRYMMIVLPVTDRTALAGFALLVVTHLVLANGDQYPLLSRFLILIESGMGLVLVRMIRGSVAYQRAGQLMGKNMWFRLFDVWLRVIPALFIGALGTSFLGYRSLAIAMDGLAVLSIFLGTLFLGAVRIVEGIVQTIVDAGKLNRLRMIMIQPERFLTVTRRGLRALAFFGWFYYALNFLTLWEPLRDSVANVLSARFGYGALTLSLGGLFAFALTLWISWLLSRFVTYVLDREVFTRVSLTPGVPFALSSFTRYTILVVGVLVAMATLGIPMDRLALLISALGVGIGFGLQTVVNNFVSGIILLFERPIRVGDKVELDNLTGTVTNIGIRASNVRSFDGADVIVPNGDFIAARVINWTLADRKRRIILPVGVAYGTDPATVLKILESVARSHVEVLVDPAPEALFRGFGESSLDFELRAWTDSERGWPAIMSELAVATYDALNEAGIGIPFPQRDLHLKSVNEKIRDVLSGEKEESRAGEGESGEKH